MSILRHGYVACVDGHPVMPPITAAKLAAATKCRPAKPGGEPKSLVPGTRCTNGFITHYCNPTTGLKFEVISQSWAEYQAAVKKGAVGASETRTAPHR